MLFNYTPWAQMMGAKYWAMKVLYDDRQNKATDYFNEVSGTKYLALKVLHEQPHGQLPEQQDTKH